MADDNNTPPPAPEKPWFDTLDAETKGYLQNKGLDQKTAVEAFAAAAKAHREAEKFVGAPANEILRLPKDANAPEWKNIWERLGAPKDAKDYDFSAVKFADGTALDEAFTDFMRERIAPLHLPKDAAAGVAKAFVEFMDKTDAGETAEKTAKLAEEKAALQKNWGANAAANMVVAQAAVKALGVDPEAVNALEGSIGYAKVMDMFRIIGSKIGEDKFVSSANKPGGVMTREQALDEKKALMSDSLWVQRYNKGGREEQGKMLALDKIITGVAA